MRRGSLAILSILIAMAVPAYADMESMFIGEGTYASEEGCRKLAALAAGGDRNLGTVPETLTAEGFEGWEHRCTFTSISEKIEGRSWVAKMTCTEGDSEDERTTTFEKLDGDRFKMTTDGETDIYVRCGAVKGK